MSMCSKVISNGKIFCNILRSLQDGSKDLHVYEEDIQILKINADSSTVLKMCSGNRPVFICERTILKTAEPDNEDLDKTGSDSEVNSSQIQPTPQPLTINKARQLLSFYTVTQNPNVRSGEHAVLHPLWVRCDMADPARTTWLGAEMVYSGKKVTAVKLYSVNCKGATAEKGSFMTLDELKTVHKRKHHPTSMVLKGSAQYTLFGSTVVENTLIESQSCVTVDFKWNDVQSVLETPHMSSSAILNIRVASGDVRSPVFEVFRELEFLQVLADGLRTGATEWLEPLESKSAVELTKAYLEELQNTANAPQDQAVKSTEALKVKTELFNSLLERGDLDFVEQLWVRMRRSVTSYQDIGDSLELVINALKYGYIKPWIHRDSSSSLSKLILQSYHTQIDSVPLTGLAPVLMLLEMGLDKMRKDYINYLIGKELTTLNHLCYYLSTEVDLQEQVTRVRKLHHLLEIVVTCSEYLGLPYGCLFILTQSCLQYYQTCGYDEDHEFNLPVKSALVNHFCEKKQPAVWGVEVSSGHGSREVHTSWQLSDKPLVDHVLFDTDDCNDSVVEDGEEVAYFSTMAYCNLINLT